MSNSHVTAKQLTNWFRTRKYKGRPDAAPPARARTTSVSILKHQPRLARGRVHAPGAVEGLLRVHDVADDVVDLVVPTIVDSSPGDSETQSVWRNFLEKTWPSEAKRSENSVMYSLHSWHRAWLVLARSTWVIRGRSVGLSFRAVVCAQGRQANQCCTLHKSGGSGAGRARCAGQGRLRTQAWRCAAARGRRAVQGWRASGWHTGFEIPIGVGALILPMTLAAGGVVPLPASVSLVMGAT
eukprot:scaffold62600_cov60-Phaeocystis_antarctica.AAC.1